MGKVSARLGNTEYKMEDDGSPNVLKVTRRNKDGTKEFFIPRRLVLSYARDVMKRKVNGLVDLLLED